LTGVLSPDSRLETLSDSVENLELLVNGPGDVVVLAKPGWWTLRRLLAAVGALVAALALAVVWIALLRRRIAQHALRLQQEIRERERAERRNAIEKEQSRIARDLHDELGTGLTEMSLLASAGLAEPGPSAQTGGRLEAIARKARALVSSLDVIVWAIDPRRNSVQAFADYLGDYVKEFLASSGIVCQLDIPIECHPVALSGPERHSLLLAVKEALNNIIRHAAATEVRLCVNQSPDALEILLSDNGRGFEWGAIRPGCGLANLRERLEAMRGGVDIRTGSGKGTAVHFKVPLPRESSNPMPSL
jgi:signal transduction histidine kinase